MRECVFIFMLFLNLLASKVAIGQNNVYVSESKHKQFGKLYAVFLDSDIIVLESFEHIKKDTWYRFVDTLRYDKNTAKFTGHKSVLIRENNSQKFFEIKRGKGSSQRIGVVFMPINNDELRIWNYRKNQIVLREFLIWDKKNTKIEIKESKWRELDSMSENSTHSEFSEYIYKLMNK